MSNIYRCSQCNRAIGLMIEPDGRATLFKCPHTGRVAQAADTMHEKRGESTRLNAKAYRVRSERCRDDDD